MCDNYNNKIICRTNHISDYNERERELICYCLFENDYVYFVDDLPNEYDAQNPLWIGIAHNAYSQLRYAYSVYA